MRLQSHALLLLWVTLDSFNMNTCHLGCVTPWPCSKDWCRTAWVSLTWLTVWFTWMVWLSFQKWKRNTYITCTLCLSTSGSRICSPSQPSVNSSGMRLTIWLIMSPMKAYDPARRTWKLWLNPLHHKPTLQSKPFGALWDIINGFLRFLYASHNHCMSICLEKVPVRRLSMSHSWQIQWMPSRCLRKPVVRLM